MSFRIHQPATQHYTVYTVGMRPRIHAETLPWTVPASNIWQAVYYFYYFYRDPCIPPTNVNLQWVYPLVFLLPVYIRVTIWRLGSLGIKVCVLDLWEICLESNSQNIIYCNWSIYLLRLRLRTAITLHLTCDEIWTEAWPLRLKLLAAHFSELHGSLRTHL
jgi:hypothetical protein